MVLKVAFLKWLQPITAVIYMTVFRKIKATFLQLCIDRCFHLMGRFLTVILVKACTVRRHVEKDGGTKQFAINLHFHSLAVQNGCHIFFMFD